MCDLLTSPFVEELRRQRAEFKPPLYQAIFPTALPIDSLEDEDWMECDLHPRIEP